MIKVFLLVVALAGPGGQSVVVLGDFKTLAECELAREAMSELRAHANDSVDGVCVAAWRAAR